MLAWSFVLFSQDVPKPSTYSEDQFKELIAQPTKFTEKEQGDIYMQHIKSLIASNIDTGYILFDEMANFGIKNNNNLVAAMAYNNKASMYLMMRDSEKSFPYLNKALPLAYNYPDTYMNVLYNFSLYYQSIGKIDSAMMMLDTAQVLNSSGKVSKKQQASYYIVRAELLSDLNKYHTSIESYQDALNVQSLSENPLKYSNTLFRISELYSLINNNQMALNYVKEAIQISEKNKYLSSLAGQLIASAKYEIYFQNYKQAELQLNKSRNISQERKDSIKLSRSYSTLALLSLKKEQLAQASTFINQAKRYGIAIKDIKDELPLLEVEGELALRSKNYSASERIYNQLLNIARQTQQTSVSIDAFEGLKNTAVAMGNYKQAVAYSDSLLNYIEKKDLTDQSNILYDLETKYQKKQQDKEISFLNDNKIAQDKVIAVRNNTIILGSIMLIILSLLLLGLYTLYKKNQESQRKLALQNIKITETLAQNQLLIKEIHHRVKNNLQVISSLLHLQERKVEDGAAREALKSSQARVNTMSLIHKSLYQKDDVRFVDVKQYFTKLTENLVSSFALGDVELTIDIEPLKIDVDSLVPLGLVANELICNALKHGIKDKKDGKISVTLHQKDDDVVLIVEDNGGGLTTNELTPKEGSLGTRLIKAFTNNLEGNLIIEGGDNTKISLVVPKSQLIFK